MRSDEATDIFCKLLCGWAGKMSNRSRELLGASTAHVIQEYRIYSAGQQEGTAAMSQYEHILDVAGAHTSSCSRLGPWPRYSRLHAWRGCYAARGMR